MLSTINIIIIYVIISVFILLLFLATFSTKNLISYSFLNDIYYSSKDDDDETEFQKNFKALKEYADKLSEEANTCKRNKTNLGFEIQKLRDNLINNTKLAQKIDREYYNDCVPVVNDRIKEYQTVYKNLYNKDISVEDINKMLKIL